MLSRHKGFSMIEVLVTIFITVIGLLGISSLQLQSNRAVQDSGNKSQAIWILKDLSNRINANSSALSDYATTLTAAVQLQKCVKTITTVAVKWLLQAVVLVKLLRLIYGIPFALGVIQTKEIKSEALTETLSATLF